jgi:hypothetical protein
MSKDFQKSKVYGKDALTKNFSTINLNLRDDITTNETEFSMNE